MAILKGEKAPDFTLINTTREQVSLKDFTGKTLVIHFFPAAFTRVCTEQLCSSRDELSFYNDIDAAVIGVSVDLPFTLAVFKTEQHINFPLLSDFNKTMIRDYDMYLDDFILGLKGVAKRGVVVVNAAGMVSYSEETIAPGTQVDFAALKAALSHLK